MRRMLLFFAALLVAGNAGAQWRSFGDDRDDRGRGNRYRPELIDRVLRDVDSAQYDRFAARHERHQFEQARKDLLRFEDRWYRGDFDRGRLDGAIGHLDHIVRSPYVDPRERHVLERDLWDLRAFRERRGVGGGYDHGWR